MSTESIKVLIVEDHLLTRLGLTMVLNAWPTITVVGEADNGITALDLINEIKPDVAVVDIGLPQMDGIECTTIVKSSNSNARILLRSSHQEDDAILAVIGSGADGYCFWEAAPLSTATSHPTLRVIPRNRLQENREGNSAGARAKARRCGGTVLPIRRWFVRAESLAKDLARCFLAAIRLSGDARFTNP